MRMRLSLETFAASDVKDFTVLVMTVLQSLQQI